MLAVATGTLASAETPELDEKSAITVVMAAKGYPGTPEKGGHIRNIEVYLARLLEELSTGRTQSVEDIRAEIKILARTIAADRSGGRSAG